MSRRAPALALLTALGFAGCAAWDAARAVAPVACAAMGAYEARGCALHLQADVPESDPRAVALHATGAQVDALESASSAELLGDLADAVRAFAAAVEAVTSGPKKP